MKSNYEQRKANRIAHYEKLAEKNAQKSEQQSEQAFKMASVVPMGQPILIGHHSEKRDRRYRNRIHNLQRQSFESQAKSDYYTERAASAMQNDSISSDDPEAIAKLKEKLEGLEKKQNMMKAANKIIRNKKLDEKTRLAKLIELGINEILARELRGYEHFELSNNNANIVRIRGRIVQLGRKSKVESNEIIVNGVRMLQNMEANRLQLFFPGKPDDEVRKQLKRRGFRWSPTEGAWQRHVSRDAQYAAMEIVKSLKKDDQQA